MPNYSYQCDKCKYQFDIHQDFSEDSLTVCPECGQEALLKIYRPARIMFKGSGFYVNDNKTSSRNYLSDKKEASSSDAKETKPEPTTSAETAKAETKSEAK